MKYGLLNYCYGRERYFVDINFGDEIQSIASSYFLPQIDCFIDREKIGQGNDIHDDKVKVIMNGWYIHDQSQWPPAKNIIPLLTSIHIMPNKKVFIKKLFSNNNIDYLMKYGPVGTRDLGTLELFKKYNVPAFFSGCMTLTLPKDEKINKQDYILCVDIRDDIVKRIKQITKRDVYCISPAFNYPLMTPLEKFQYAKCFLNAYQSAAAVITTRLHTAMPCLALETPVLLIDDSNDTDIRFWGLGDLVRKSSSDYYLKNMDLFDVNNIVPNSNEYLDYRTKLINQCEKFTGCKQQKYSPLFGNITNEKQNIKNLEVLRNVSDRFKNKKILYRFASKDLINASVKRSYYKTKNMIEKFKKY